MKTELARTIQITDKDAQYDECAKRILGNKYVLAYIMIHTVNEFQEMTPEEVLPCFVGEPHISKVPVNPGETNKSTVHDKERVITFNTENGEINEGILRFDVIFRIRMKQGISEIIVNVEAQKDSPSNYPVLNRAVFFACRMISSQKERDFSNDSYGDIKPVYSIWINMNQRQDSLTHYQLAENRILGKSRWKGNPKLINIVMVGLAKTLPKKKQPELHHLLGTLFSKELAPEDKLEIIRKKYRIPIEKELGEELKDMCNLSQGIREEATLEGIEIGKEIGKEEGRLEEKEQLIRAMYKNHMSLEQIATVTDIPLEKVREIVLTTSAT